MEPHLPQTKTQPSQDNPHPSHIKKSDSFIDGLLAAMGGVVIKEQLNEQAIHLLSLVPKGYIPLPHQVGGHRHIDGKPGMMRL